MNYVILHINYTSIKKKKVWEGKLSSGDLGKERPHKKRKKFELNQGILCLEELLQELGIKYIKYSV